MKLTFLKLDIFWRPTDRSSFAAAGASVSLDEADVPLGRGAAGLRGTQTQTGRDGALVGVQLLENMALSIRQSISHSLSVGSLIWVFIIVILA